jgi:hypothetical protein
MRPRLGMGSARCRTLAGLAGLGALLVACATDEGGSEPRGRGILRVQVLAEETGAPVADATIRLFADYSRSCAEQGPLTAELVTDAGGALRIEAEGVQMAGGTCLSLSVVAPERSGLQSAQRVPFVLEFRTELPLDSVQVDVALATAP